MKARYHLAMSWFSFIMIFVFMLLAIGLNESRFIPFSGISAALFFGFTALFFTKFTKERYGI